MVIAGNWPWWLIDSGRTGTLVQLAKVDSGTWSPVVGDLTIDLVQRVEVALQLRQDFQDHVVAVELGEVLRHLALAEGVIERIVDQLRGDAVARGGVAVDLQLERGALGLLVGGDVAQLRQRLHLGQDLRRPLIELGEIGVLQREFELGAGRPAAEADVLRGLHIEAGALDLLELGTQPRDDLLGGGVALAARLQRDEQVAVVAGAAAAADRHRGGGDAGIGQHDLGRAPPAGSSSPRRRCPARLPRSR